MPRQARKPCSGWGRHSRISSQSAAVAGPIEAASRRMRSTVQSAYRRWLDGMCSGTVVCRWLLLARASHPRPHRPALVGRHVMLLHPAAYSGAEVQHRLLTYRIIKEICNAARELAGFPAPFFSVLPDLFVADDDTRNPFACTRCGGLRATRSASSRAVWPSSSRLRPNSARPSSRWSSASHWRWPVLSSVSSPSLAAPSRAVLALACQGVGQLGKPVEAKPHRAED